MSASLKHHYLRIDARSLGLFRIFFGFVLIGDLFRRWKYLSEFYSNDGILPNHNHLFNLIQKGSDQVFSVYHAFSSRGENHFAFLVTLIIYFLFLIGFKTRIFHALSLVCLISLGARNILLENAGNYAAIAILAFTLFLPCGSRFAIDSLRASMEREPEKTDTDLNRRTPENEALLQAQRGPGFSPLSLAALAVQLQIAIIFICSALSHNGAAWKDGSAVYYALQNDRIAGCLGALLNPAPPPVLRGLTYLLYGAEWFIPLLILLPAPRRPARLLAAWMVGIYGLLHGLLFSFGLYGYALCAAAPLLLNTDVWEAYCKVFQPKRARTIIYDSDCGVCLWIARLLKRSDLRGQLAFQGNHRTDVLLVRKADGSIGEKEWPSSIKPEITNNTVVVVMADGTIYTKSRAVAEALRPLFFGWIKAWPLLIPGLSGLFDKLYDAFATRRHRVSELLGMGVCGVPQEEDGASPDDSANSIEVAPFTQQIRRLRAGLREILAAIVFAAMIVQSAAANPLPISASIPQNKTLIAVATWPRMLAKWNVLSPEPPRENSAFVIDAQTKNGLALDLLTGKEPALSPALRRGHNMGQLWTDFFDRMREKDMLLFQKAFRDFLGKGGIAYFPANPADPLIGYDAYWIVTPIPEPGAPKPTEDGKREKLWTHARGGKLSAESKAPQVRPGLIQPK